jgi:actin related protein 2/3 complex subunit 2
MILLEFHNRIIEEALSSRLEQHNEGEQIDGICMSVADFDGTIYQLANPGDDTNIVKVSIGLTWFHELEAHGVRDFLKAMYGDLVADTPESDYNFTLTVTISALNAELIHQIAKLRRNCFAGVFGKFFALQKDGKPGEQAVFHYKDDETFYVNVLKDRVTVVFSTRFKDADDVVIGKVFMQAFQDVRGKNPNAPQVLFSPKDPPSEIQGLDALVGDNVGHVTFVLFPRHTSEDKMDKTIDLIHTFRDYLHYHIKCSKAYLHQRMRARTAALLKVLNRARPEEEKEKKTASGRTFLRK